MAANWPKQTLGRWTLDVISLDLRTLHLHLLFLSLPKLVFFLDTNQSTASQTNGAIWRTSESTRLASFNLFIYFFFSILSVSLKGALACGPVKSKSKCKCKCSSRRAKHDTREREPVFSQTLSQPLDLVLVSRLGCQPQSTHKHLRQKSSSFAMVRMVASLAGPRESRLSKMIR